VDTALCVGCGMCTTKCKFDAISLVRVYDSPGAAFEDLKPIVIKQILTRKVKIAGKKVTRSIKSMFDN
jgi:translation initiation factor RLI1